MEVRVPKMAPLRPKLIFLGPKKMLEFFFRMFIPKHDV